MRARAYAYDVKGRSSPLSGSATVRLNQYVKVLHAFANSQFRIQGKSWSIVVVCLNEDDIRSTGQGNPLELMDQCRCYALATVRCRHRQIVDVDLTALLFELLQFVGRNAPDNLATL